MGFGLFFGYSIVAIFYTIKFFENVLRNTLHSFGDGVRDFWCICKKKAAYQSIDN